MRHERTDPRALHVARATIYLARDWHFGHLVPAGAAELCARFLYSFSPREVHRISRAHSQTFRQFLSALEYLTVPGMALHYAARKLAIEEAVRTGIAAGAQQVVVLAPGFDTLALRLHREFPQVRFVEVDCAANQTIKRRALMGQWAPGKNFAFVAADVGREPLGPKLLDGNYAPGVPAVFVAEAVLALLDEPARTALLDFMHMRGGPGCRLVFTAMERGPDGGVRFRGATWIARLWWGLRGTRFEWGPSRDELEAYLGEYGFALDRLLTAKDFRLRYLDGNPDVPLAEGEDVAVAHVVKF